MKLQQRTKFYSQMPKWCQLSSSSYILPSHGNYEEEITLPEPVAQNPSYGSHNSNHSNKRETIKFPNPKWKEFRQREVIHQNCCRLCIIYSYTEELGTKTEKGKKTKSKRNKITPKQQKVIHWSSKFMHHVQNKFDTVQQQLLQKTYVWGAVP